MCKSDLLIIIFGGFDTAQLWPVVVLLQVLCVATTMKSTLLRTVACNRLHFAQCLLRPLHQALLLPPCGLTGSFLVVTAGSSVLRFQPCLRGSVCVCVCVCCVCVCFSLPFCTNQHDWCLFFFPLSCLPWPDPTLCPNIDWKWRCAHASRSRARAAETGGATALADHGAGAEECLAAAAGSRPLGRHGLQRLQCLVLSAANAQYR